MAHESVPYYFPGQNITGQADDDLTGCRFVAITDDMTADPEGLSDSAVGGTVVIGKPSAGGKVLGVLVADLPEDGFGMVHVGGVVPVEVASAISAFDTVEVDNTGKVKTQASGVGVGICLSGTATGNAPILLFGGVTGEAGVSGVSPQADITDLTNSTGGTGNNTVAALPTLTDTPATADALRDDINTNLYPVLKDNFSDLAVKINAILAALRSAGILV